MGLRFRKSINLGGGFKINLSKSGIGYSWGTKGFRYTRKSTGGSRTTASIYGTGLSWVSETGKKKKYSSGNNSYVDSQSSQQTQNATVVQTYDTETIENSNATNLVSAGLEDMLSLATKTLCTYKWIMRGFWATLVLGCFNSLFWIMAIGLLIYSFAYKKNNAIDLEYTIDDDLREEIAEIMRPIKRIANCNKVWRIIESSKVADKKYSSGASNLIKRNVCTTSMKIPFPFRTSEESISLKSDKENLLFLPDKLFVIQGTKVGALNYKDIIFSVTGTRFIETESVPNDAKVVDYTWEYVNKSGGPDRRFKDNRQLPICYYGELKLRSSNGLNTIIMFSSVDI